MSLGWIMFWKALVVAIWVPIVDAWIAFRKRRAERGLPLRQNSHGVYVPSDWTAWVEVAVRAIGRFFTVLVGAAMLVSITIAITGFFGYLPSGIQQQWDRRGTK